MGAILDFRGTLWYQWVYENEKTGEWTATGAIYDKRQNVEPPASSSSVTSTHKNFGSGHYTHVGC